MAPRLTAFCILIVMSAILATGLALAGPPPVERLEQSCEAGSSSSCAYLGVLYRHGKGVPRDYVRAIEYQRKACARGNQFSCGYVGDMTYQGLGTEENKDDGAQMMRAACANGNKWSCDTLRRHGLTATAENTVAANGR